MPKTREKRVIFIRSNPPDRDVRVPKETRALKQAGYRTSLLFWDRDCHYKKIRDAKEREQVGLRLRAPYGVKVLPFFPIWWGFVFFQLLITRWQVAHAINLDCAIPTLLAGKLKRKPVIYEILDIEYEARLPKAVLRVCTKLDKLFMRLADGIIVADEAQIEGLGGIPNHRVAPIYDSPPDAFTGKDTAHAGHQGNTTFMLFYAGVLYRNKRLNLDKVIKAIEDIDGAKLVIAGYGDLVKEIEELSHHMPHKVEFIGKISYEEVIERGLQADLFFILRDPTLPTNKYTCGSNLFNAMICGKPILASAGSSTAIKVNAENCGLVVDADSVEQIGQAIIKLKNNPQLCKELGANGRKAYEQRYSWAIMEQHLIGLYRQLIPERTGNGNR